MRGMKKLKPINSNNNNYSTDKIPCDGCGRYVTDEEWDPAGDGRRLCSECEYRESHED